MASDNGLFALCCSGGHSGTESLDSRDAGQRVFFALWPDDGLRTAFARATSEAVRASGGRPVPAHNLHATLVFLGSVAKRRIPQIEAIANRVAAASGAAAEAAAAGSAASGTVVSSTASADAPLRPSLVFDRIEHWEKPRLLCATTSTSSAAASALAEALRQNLTAAGFTPDLKPFRAHVTLARKVPRGSHESTMHSVLWSFTEFALVESRTGAQGSLYSVLNSWPLCTEVRKMPEKKHK
jgi:2'-5' RNA ligase